MDHDDAAQQAAADKYCLEHSETIGTCKVCQPLTTEGLDRSSLHGICVGGDLTCKNNDNNGDGVWSENWADKIQQMFGQVTTSGANCKACANPLLAMPTCKHCANGEAISSKCDPNRPCEIGDEGGTCDNGEVRGGFISETQQRAALPEEKELAGTCGEYRRLTWADVVHE